MPKLEPYALDNIKATIDNGEKAELKLQPSQGFFYRALIFPW